MPLPQRKLIPGILLFLVLAALAAPPLWWGDPASPVINSNPANNHGPANIGQAKHMAKSALDALRPILPTVAAAIEADLVGPGKPIPSWEPPANQAEKDKNHAPLLIGPLKAIADPFYRHLHTAAPAWLEQQLYGNLTKDTANPENFFPWTNGLNDDNNKAVANIGQLKAVFSLRFDTLLPDFTNEDSDGDGLTFEQEIALGSNPNKKDTDDDGLKDGEDADPLHSKINWHTTSEPNFAVIELGLEDSEDLQFEDLSHSGTVLSSKSQQSTPETRVIVDKNRHSHELPGVGPSLGDSIGFFGSFPRTLIDDNVLGTRLIPPTPGVSEDCTWDPVTDIYTPYVVPWYIDDVLDDRHDFRVEKSYDFIEVSGEWIIREFLLTPYGELADSNVDDFLPSKIEQNGNIISPFGYWRFDAGAGAYGERSALPEQFPKNSATLVQEAQDVGLGGTAVQHSWNLVAGHDSLLAAHDDGPFSVTGVTCETGEHSIAVTSQGWLATEHKIWSNGKWKLLADVVSGPKPTQVTLLGMLDTGLGVARLKFSDNSTKLVLLLPVDLVAHKRGTINTPGGRIQRPAEGDYEAVTIENGDLDQFDNVANARVLTPADADNADLQDAKKNRVATQEGGNLGAVALANDDDFIKVYIEHGIPDGLKFDAELELVEAAGTQKITKDKIFLYTKEGKAVDISTLKFTDSVIPSSGAMHDFFDKDRGLFVEIGDLGELASGRALAEAERDHFKEITLRLKAKFQEVEITPEVKIKRGGFWVYDRSRNSGLSLFDGKGHVKPNTNTLEVHDGKIITSWFETKNGQRGTSNESTSNKGPSPDGWYDLSERTAYSDDGTFEWRQAGYYKRSGNIQSDRTIFPLPLNEKKSDINKDRSPQIYQGGYSLWKGNIDGSSTGEGHISSGDQRIYDPGVDGNTAPTSVKFKFDMQPDASTNRAGRSALQVHPDGHNDGTLGCIGLQSYQEALRVKFLMRHLRATGVDVRNQPTKSWNTPPSN